MPPSEEATKHEQPKLNRIVRDDTKIFVGGIERGMVFWGDVREDETRDSEHFHDRDRPCPWIVLSTEAIHRRLPVVLAAPLTSRLEKADGQNFRFYRIRLLHAHHFIHYQVSAGQKPLTGDSLILPEQLRVFAHDRIVGNPIAKATRAGLAAAEAGLRFVLDMP